MSRLREKRQNLWDNTNRGTATARKCSGEKSTSRAGKGGQMNHKPLLFREEGLRNSCVTHLNSLPMRQIKDEQRKWAWVSLSRRSTSLLISMSGYQSEINHIIHW